MCDKIVNDLINTNLKMLYANISKTFKKLTAKLIQQESFDDIIFKILDIAENWLEK